ncbi:hypothetical protein D3C78_1780830 [compost metagenome]
MCCHATLLFLALLIRLLTLTLLYRLTLMSTSLCPQLNPPHIESTAATPRPKPMPATSEVANTEPGGGG